MGEHLCKVLMHNTLLHYAPIFNTHTNRAFCNLYCLTTETLVDKAFGSRFIMKLNHLIKKTGHAPGHQGSQKAQPHVFSASV